MAEWVPPSSRVGIDFAEPGMATMRRKFEEPKKPAVQEVFKETKSTAKKMHVTKDLTTNNVFIEQQSLLSAEDAAAERGATVHPSQADAEDVRDDAVPAWRLKEIEAHEKEVNDPDMLTAREAERVEARRKDKAAKEAEILAKIEAMSP